MRASGVTMLPNKRVEDEHFAKQQCGGEKHPVSVGEIQHKLRQNDFYNKLRAKFPFKHILANKNSML